MAKLLVIDDDLDILELLTDYLANEGHHVVVARTCAEVGSVLDVQADFKGVVLDWCLPGCNGIDMLARISQKLPSCPVLVTTGHGRDTIPGQSPVFGVVRKPYSLRALALRIEAMTTTL
jgi:DNA-binding response OmpR family regulator